MASSEKPVTSAHYEHEVTPATPGSEFVVEEQKRYFGQTKGAWYIYWICGVASIANIFQGFDNGMYSIILSDDKFLDYFNLFGARQGAVASMMSLGCIIANFFISWWFIWFLGRRWTFIMGTFVVFVGVALQAGAVSYAMIIIGRIIAGIGAAILGTNLAAYQAEVSSPLIRGRVVSTVQLSYQVGALIAYCVGLGTVHIAGNNSWRTSTAVQLVPGLILVLAALTLPESPRWLMEKHPDQPDRVLTLLAKIRCLPEQHPEVQSEFMDLVAAHQYRVEYEGAFTWRKFFSSYSIWKRLAYGMATMALGQISGVSALMQYGVLIYRSLGFSGTTESLLLNVVSGLLCLLATAITMSGVDKWGRRPTLIAGSAIMVISYIIIAALADAYPAASNFNRVAAGWQVAFIYIIQMSYSGALGPCAWIYACEIFPSDLRDKGVNISQSGQQITSLWISQAWPSMFDNVGHDAYWILMGINVIGLVVVILFWPETKGVSLEHMDSIFGEADKVDAWRANKKEEPAVGGGEGPGGRRRCPGLIPS